MIARQCTWDTGQYTMRGRHAREIAAEQVAFWRASGDVSVADVMGALGYSVGRRRHTGRSWAELELIIAREWWDLYQWNRQLEAA